MSQSKSWGFPRWGAYGFETDPTTVRLCDFQGCQKKGEFPAPKSPNSSEKWWFCQTHAGEFNRNWDYFQGLSKEEARRREEEELRRGAGYRTSGAYNQGPSSYGQEAARNDALDILGLDDGASAEEIKSAFRQLAKQYHPDTNPDDEEAALKFRQVTLAYDTLKDDIRSSHNKTGS
ncbi:MAG: molecular chaperone DnaJ [Kordiimonas sp.]|nr:molecular chaperone DnaJ [Kordiimonas sp.]